MLQNALINTLPSGRI